MKNLGSIAPSMGRIAKMGYSKDGEHFFVAKADKYMVYNNFTLEKVDEHFLSGLNQYSISMLSNARVVGLVVSSNKMSIFDTWEILSDTIIPIVSEKWTMPSFSSDGQYLAMFTGDNFFYLMDLESQIVIYQRRIEDLSLAIAFSPNDECVAFSNGNKIIVYFFENNEEVVLKYPDTHCLCLTWNRSSNLLVAGNDDGSIFVWDVQKRRPKTIIEGHTETIKSISFSYDDSLLASQGRDDKIIIWDCKNWEILHEVFEPTTSHLFSMLVFHPYRHELMTLSDQDEVVSIWAFDSFQNKAPYDSKSLHYSTAKIALVGDTGVGKTGLGWCLAHGEFKEHSSTHGEQFWVLDTLNEIDSRGHEHEVILWDFAGQHDYRLLHTLFLDDADLILILFDPTVRQDPLKGVEYWVKTINNKNTESSKILVGARTDRGDITLSKEEIQKFCEYHNIEGGYISTSAATDYNLDKLRDKIKSSIQWDEKIPTSTTQLFKEIKDHVLKLKESPLLTKRLILISELKEELEEICDFTDSEILGAIRSLKKHGFVNLITTSKSEKMVLLSPDLLVNLASSFVIEARRNEKGLGALEEDKIIHNSYNFNELKTFDITEQEIMFDATILLFIQNHICFRERLGNNTYLIFPGLINQKKPQFEDEKYIEDVSYTVMGSVENVYSALVVLLGYTNTFTRTNQWQNQAQYEVDENEICGFRQISEKEGEVTFILYYSEQVPQYIRNLFQGLFEKFLLVRDVKVKRFTPVICTNCDYQQERSEIVRRLQRGKDHLFCTDCGKKLEIDNVEESLNLTVEEKRQLYVEQKVAEGRSIFETALSRITRLINESEIKEPSCFISYAHGNVEQETWIERHLATDLRNVGIDVILDRWHNKRIGEDVARFISKIKNANYIIVVGTKLYLTKYENQFSQNGSIVAAEMDLINQRMIGTEEEKKTVLPLIIESESDEVLPPLLAKKVRSNFSNAEDYFLNLFNLVLTIYNIPYELPVISECIKDLTPRDAMINAK
ncbi:GTP-binding protein [Brevibacillus sp. MS2.2]|nr:GTP-binding protein [Brevibacillus sp. MS2.2]NRR20990.1 GTP-binding protein [Brevibacillus sp. MS2.2]